MSIALWCWHSLRAWQQLLHVRLFVLPRIFSSTYRRLLHGALWEKGSEITWAFASEPTAHRRAKSCTHGSWPRKCAQPQKGLCMSAVSRARATLAQVKDVWESADGKLSPQPDKIEHPRQATVQSKFFDVFFFKIRGCWSSDGASYSYKVRVEDKSNRWRKSNRVKKSRSV